MDNHFLIVVPVYNTAPYIRKCLESALNQTYRQFDMIVVDDCSTDGTSGIISEVWEETERFVYYRNDVRTESPVGNFALGIDFMNVDRETIIICLDGDDWLYNNNVLAHVNEVYQDPDVWLTYGSYVSASGKVKDTSKVLTSTRDYRKNTTWCTSHLRTIKKKLWDKIDHADLKDKDGNYYVYYPDAAYMFPAIEMAGLKHIRYIPETLYVYNDRSPLCSADDWKTKDMAYRYAVSKEIRSKKPYEELTELW